MSDQPVSEWINAEIQVHLAGTPNSGREVYVEGETLPDLKVIIDGRAYKALHTIPDAELRLLIFRIIQRARDRERAAPTALSPVGPMITAAAAPPEARDWPRLRWWQIWSMAIFKPSVATYIRIIYDPGAAAGRAFLWVALATFVTLSISLGVSLPSMPEILAEATETQLKALCSESAQYCDPAFQADIRSRMVELQRYMPLILFVIIPALSVIFSLLWLVTWSRCADWLAVRFGGASNRTGLVMGLAAFTAPLAFVGTAIGLALSLPFFMFPPGTQSGQTLTVYDMLSLLSTLISIALIGYQFSLSVTVIRAANRLTTGPALGSSILSGIFSFAVFFGVFLSVCLVFYCVTVGLAAAFGAA